MYPVKVVLCHGDCQRRVEIPVATVTDALWSVVQHAEDIEHIFVCVARNDMMLALYLQAPSPSVAAATALRFCVRAIRQVPFLHGWEIAEHVILDAASFGLSSEPRG